MIHGMNDTPPEPPCLGCRITGTVGISAVTSYSWYLRYTKPVHKKFYTGLAIAGGLALIWYTKTNYDRVQVYDSYMLKKSYQMSQLPGLYTK